MGSFQWLLGELCVAKWLRDLKFFLTVFTFTSNTFKGLRACKVSCINVKDVVHLWHDFAHWMGSLDGGLTV